MKLLLSVELIDAAVRVVRIANTDRLASSSIRVKPRTPVAPRAGLPMQRIGEATAAAFDESFMFESLESCSVQLCVVCHVPSSGLLPLGAELLPDNRTLASLRKTWCK